MKNIFIMTVFAVLCLAGCVNENSGKSGPGENCTRTFDCIEGYKCYGFICLDEESPDTADSDDNIASMDNDCVIDDPDQRVDDDYDNDVNGRNAEMVTVPAGSFWMGCNESYDSSCCNNEYPYHKVTLPDYKIDKFEVTVADYQKCIDSGACGNKNKINAYYLKSLECNLLYNKSDLEPVNCVSWYGARAYCIWKGKRLPTEAEWEKAARGTDSRIYPWGNEEADCHYAIMYEPPYQVGPYQAGGAGCGENRPLPVGSRMGVSPYLAYDMAGNVYEWVNDWYQKDYYLFSPEESPECTESGIYRVVRGGSWFSVSWELRTSMRTGSNPADFMDIVGFRCAADQCEPEEKRFITCAEDSSKFQKQICDSGGFWVNKESCFCKKGAEKKVNCAGKRMEFMKQICDENGNWLDKGLCYCVTGSVKVVQCSGEITKFRKMICNEKGEWEDEGSCFEPFSDVLCSGQKQCFNNAEEISCPFEDEYFYGQDFQYAVSGFCIPENLSVSVINSEKVVTDFNTGLKWQGLLPETYSGCATGKECTWQEAVDYCGSLNYGGFDDWRLPSMEELDTVIDYGEYESALDKKYFSAALSKYFVSSTSIADNLDNAWYLNSADGSDGEYIKTTAGSVMCVRGSNLLQHNFAEETLSGDNIFTDSVTGLQWALNYKKEILWENALDYCETLNYAGFSDWRLPGINELKSAVNRKKFDPASDISGIPIEIFWSSTSYYFKPFNAFTVEMSYGLAQIMDKHEHDIRVMCVRSQKVFPVFDINGKERD